MTKDGSGLQRQLLQKCSTCKDHTIKRLRDNGNGRTKDDTNMSLPTKATNKSRRTDNPLLENKFGVAAEANVSKRTVDTWMLQKKIPFIRISPRCVRFDVPKVLAALARFTVKEIAA